MSVKDKERGLGDVEPAEKKQASRAPRFYEYDAQDDLSPVLLGVFLEVEDNSHMPGLVLDSVSFHVTVDGLTRGAYIGPCDVRRLRDWLTAWLKNRNKKS